MTLAKGDKLIIRTPGGGGFGRPEDRHPSLVEEDRREGYLG
jgi:N-methylhydantoinase B/oxoprolinase/acetone carboxylase alpha subunit